MLSKRILSMVLVLILVLGITSFSESSEDFRIGMSYESALRLARDGEKIANWKVNISKLERDPMFPENPDIIINLNNFYNTYGFKVDIAIRCHRYVPLFPAGKIECIDIWIDLGFASLDEKENLRRLESCNPFVREILGRFGSFGFLYGLYDSNMIIIQSNSPTIHNEMTRETAEYYNVEFRPKNLSISINIMGDD